MRKLMLVCLSLVLVLSLSCAHAETDALAGGWTVADDPAISEEVNNLFWQALDAYQTGMITVSYTPIAYLGSQVIAGTNHAILCRAHEINQKPVLVIVYLYQDLDDNASILAISDLPLGVS